MTVQYGNHVVLWFSNGVRSIVNLGVHKNKCSTSCRGIPKMKYFHLKCSEMDSEMYFKLFYAIYLKFPTPTPILAEL